MSAGSGWRYLRVCEIEGKLRLSVSSPHFALLVDWGRQGDAALVHDLDDLVLADGALAGGEGAHSHDDQHGRVAFFDLLDVLFCLFGKKTVLHYYLYPRLGLRERWEINYEYKEKIK